MSGTPPTPAAQYLRMSTEDQQHSIANQQAAIQTYAEENGYDIVSTYTDAGKSGVAIGSRNGLRNLLKDVVSGQALFKAILVYDVSRWGRFQDSDEAAHYEFLCKTAGVPIHYCAEQFVNDGTIPSSIMKALKRAMAAEYSRELGIKVGTGQRRLVRAGFRVCGNPGFGLRRMIVSSDGRRKLIVETGDRKAIHSDHTVLVPGPTREVDMIKELFALAVHKRNTPREIARQLNERHIKFLEGRPWDGDSVFSILKNEKYMGCNVYGKTSKKLGTPSRRLPRNQWVVNRQAFAPIVTSRKFAQVQTTIHSRNTHAGKSDEFLLHRMRQVLSRKGQLSEKLLKWNGVFDHRVFIRRFGSLLRAYDLIGYKPSRNVTKIIESQKRVKRLREELFARLRELFPDCLRQTCLPGQRFRQVLEFDNRRRVAVHICRPGNSTVHEEPRWLLKAQDGERGLPSLICTVDPSLTRILNYYVVPEFGNIIGRYKTLVEGDKWLAAGKKLEDLSQLKEISAAVARDWPPEGDNTVVGDVIFTIRTSTFTVAKKQIEVPRVNAELFKVLLHNAGRVVSRSQLAHPFNGREFPPSQLNAHMCVLRKRLGRRIGKRIKTVKGAGYMYVLPAEPELGKDQKRYQRELERAKRSRPSALRHMNAASFV